jgi:hypothetical protein
MVSLYLNDVPAPGIAVEYDLAKRFVPSITTTETAASPVSSSPKRTAW